MTLKAKEPAPGQADAIIELYTRLAQQPEQDFGSNKGKENAGALGYDEGWLERLPDIVWDSMANRPFADSLADVVISNGSINLSPHKPCVFKEIHRILAPRGRLLFGDMVREGPAEALWVVG